MKSIQAYIPIEAIQAQLQERPHDIDQRSILNDEEANRLIEYLEKQEIDLANLIMTDIYKEWVD